MKKDTVTLSESPARSHLQNVVELLNPLWWVASFFTAAWIGGAVYGLDPLLLWTLVGCGVVGSSLALAAGWCRLVEYQRLLAYIREYGIQSYYNLFTDRMFVQMGATEGRRKVLAAALGTLPRLPASRYHIACKFSEKKTPQHVWLSAGWWFNTFHPQRVQ